MLENQRAVKKKKHTSRQDVLILLYASHDVWNAAEISILEKKW